MKRFVVLYHAPEEAMKEMGNVSPEEKKKGMEPWMAWAEKCGESLVDLGKPLGSGVTVNQAGSVAKEHTVVGYSLLQAEDIEAAKALLVGHPHLAWRDDCTIELYECFPLPTEA